MYLKKYNLKGKYSFVTGAGKGLGRACAIALAEAGSNLILISRTQKDLDSVSKIAKKYKVKSKTYVCDLTNYMKLKKIVEEQKKIDVLINNAGTNIPEHFLKIRKQDMEKVVKINTIAAFNVANLVALKMVETKNRKKIGGAIVNMSSQMGHVGGPIRSVYNMTKFGIEGLTKGMGVELATKNIRVNTVAPTFVETPMVKKFFKNKKFKQLALSNIPMGKVATESDVATAVCFLASDAASMITGTSIVIDGGWTAK